MRIFTAVLKWLAPVAILVGLLHLLLGLHADVLLGARLPAEVLADPVLDSQNRFYGTCFMANGALLYLCTIDLRKYTAVFRIVCVFILLGGIARLVSLALYGLPAPQVIALTLIELAGMPALLLWHRRVLAADVPVPA